MEHYLSWELKILKKYKAKPLAVTFIILGLLLLLFGSLNYYRVRRLSFTSAPQSVNQADESDYPAELIIPSLTIDLPIDPGFIKKGVWDISPTNATFLATSAIPGQGNTVIYGHNLTAVMGKLPFIADNQKIVVKTKNGKIYNYVVTEKYSVSPDRVDLVSPTKNNQLTLYTCTGFADGKRFVVKAVPID